MGWWDDVESFFEDAADTVADGATDAANTVAGGATGAASTVQAGVTDTSGTVIELGQTVGDGFTSGYNFAVSEGISVIGKAGDGAVVAFKTASGGVMYAVDYTQAGVSSAQQWARETAGTLAGFSMKGYDAAKGWADTAWSTLQSLAQSSLPPLGPYDRRARDVMNYLFGGGASDTVVSQWEQDAISKGYTLAFDFRGAASAPGICDTAFAGIYVDTQGKWGFFAQAGTGTSMMTLRPNVQLSFEVYMVFGAVDRFGQKCLMPGLTVTVPLPDGSAVAVGGNVILTTSWGFLGFRLLAGLNLLAAQDSEGKPTYGVMPSSGPAVPNIQAVTLNASSFDAATQVKRGANESNLLANAFLAKLPFVREGGLSYYVLVQSSGHVLDVPEGSSADGLTVQQQPVNGGSNQQFQFTDVGAGSFKIGPQSGTGKALHIWGGSSNEYAQLIQAIDSGADSSYFRFLVGDDGWFSIVSTRSGKALTIINNSTEPGAAIIQHRWYGGANQKFRFIAADMQAGWRWCSKCMALFHASMPSACPTGGSHDPTGSGQYFVMYTRHEDSGTLSQDNWRWCQKCSSFWFGGLSSAGVCPKDGSPHERERSLNYLLAAATPIHVAQDNWRWCNKCQVLWFGGLSGSVCPTGGQHDSTGSANYRVMFG